MQKGKIGVTTENIFPVIKKFLYSDHDIFLREMVSNAIDATQKLKTLASCGEFKGELGDLKVEVKLDKDNGTLTISDHGIGMTAEDVDKYINQIAFSGAEEFLAKYKDNANAIIGHFKTTRASPQKKSPKKVSNKHNPLKTHSPFTSLKQFAYSEAPKKSEAAPRCHFPTRSTTHHSSYPTHPSSAALHTAAAPP